MSGSLEARTAQTHTPPDVKWLLNERAALAGEIARAQAKQASLRHKRQCLERQLAGVTSELDRSRTAQERSQASLLALDATMELAHPTLNPCAGGTVKAWAGKYGKRGGLGAFIERLLSAAAPAPLTTTVLIDLSTKEFGLELATPGERRSLRKSVSSALASLQKRELVEPLHDRTEGSHGVWRWREKLPTLDALRRQTGQSRQGQGASVWP